MKKILAGLAALVFLALFAAAPAEAGTPRNQLVVGLNMVNITSLDPHNSNSTDSCHFIANVYDTLVRVDPDDGAKLLPCAAESWEEREDGTIVFHMRKNVVFHSGNKMTADDAVYSLRRGLRLGLLVAPYFVQWGYTDENVDSKIYKTDDYTVVMEPVLPLAARLKLFQLARMSGPVLDSKLIMANEKDGDLGRAWLANNTAGSGPFKMDRWNPNDIIVLSANKDYWDGPAKLARVIIRHLPESQVARMLMEKDDLDVAMQMSSADIDGLKNNPKIEIRYVPGTGFYYLVMSAKDPEFSKPEVRKAIRYAINYDGILSTVLKNYGSRATTLIPAGVPGHQPDLNYNVYNPEKARAMLAEAGYPNGFSKQLLVLSSSPFADIATVVQANLADVGIDATIRTGNGDQTYGPMRHRKFELGVGRTSNATPSDPDGWARNHAYNPNNADDAQLSDLQAWRQSVSIPEVNALIDEGGSISDEARRAELYGKAIRIYEDAGTPLIPIARWVEALAISRRVQNYKPSPIATTRWNEVEKTD